MCATMMVPGPSGATWSAPPSRNSIPFPVHDVLRQTHHALPDGIPVRSTFIMSMSREEAIEFLLEHYNNPQFRGHIHDASFSKSGGNPGCSDIVEISARVADDGHI